MSWQVQVDAGIDNHGGPSACYANMPYVRTFPRVNAMDYLFLIVLWCLWCIVHSAMIALRVTDYLKARLGDRYRFYRLVFNGVSIVTLAPLLFYSRQIDAPVLYEWHGPLLWLKLALLAVAMGLFTIGALKYDMLSFAGIRQLRSGNRHAVMSETGAIDSTGILSLVRHPWYLAALFFIWSDDARITMPSLIVDLILTVYVVCGTLLEERKLVIELGDAYRQYQKRVPMLFPTHWRPKKPT
jgi:protein-S-isoprenylcysteine O-methyltransferase Ste14